jgi:hypothetical protein
MTYRSDVDALAARADALANEVRAKTNELETARSLLDEAKARAKLPVLPNIRVATPCSADWNAMTGDERVRACASCNKNVYNVSALTREEAEALILEKEGALCVRYYQRKDGTILLKDCSIGIRQKRKRRVVAAGVAALLGGGVFAAIRLSADVKRPAPAPTNSASVDPWDPATTPATDDAPRPEAHPTPPPDHIAKMGGMARVDRGDLRLAPPKPPHTKRPAR